MRERTWVILLTGNGADPHKLQNDRVKDPSGEFAASLDRQTLLKMTLSRARSIVPREQIAVVIDRAQKPYWGESLAMIPGANIIARPRHRGSAIEVLLAILTILERDPLARIIAMPSHHYVSNESALADSLLDAATPTAQTRNNLAFIGIKPDAADTQSDYIVPGRWFEDGTRSLLRIVKPSGRISARDLVARGALWDSSIVAARALVLVGILRMCVPDLVDQMETALAQGLDVRQRVLTQLYARLPSVDLSRVLAQGVEAKCRVITSRSCGWSNLASPQRTMKTAPPAIGKPGSSPLNRRSPDRESERRAAVDSWIIARSPAALFGQRLRSGKRGVEGRLLNGRRAGNPCVPSCDQPSTPTSMESTRSG